jgi:hypothetical protein
MVGLLVFRPFDNQTSFQMVIWTLSWIIFIQKRYIFVILKRSSLAVCLLDDLLYSSDVLLVNWFAGSNLAIWNGGSHLVLEPLDN